ncbi:MAG: universal stress protein [Dehalococcoidia bacterium]|nr:universal stress protein [Dehalococcoidia bacterium]
MARILVPLDESELAEQALPWAAELARGLACDVHLVVVWTLDERIWMRAGIDPGDSPARISEALVEYLQRAAEHPSLAGLNVTLETRMGNVAEQLAQVATEGDTRLIALTSHGEGGLKRWIQGSVADELVRSVSIPVLVVRPGEEASYRFRRLVVTLDGSDTSEKALPVARDIANAVGARVHLLRVVNPIAEVAWTGIGPAPDMGEITRQFSEAAQAYLERVANPGEKWDVLYGRPLDAILAYARENQCDVIAMGTHGRGGITRLALGSTTDAVMRAADRPVLIVPDRAAD